ncbi:hypothetical protein KP509_09G077300 [Ceratopteris richardii]|uniref:Uncharacterized protein n=1 Tax=Ceratopteris richardii TaxID=49495 RepID=A0A8T2U631_CERRI|nr:hypothetical protein KP509_09G077300 [Ceratopteris richardii]
MPYVKGNGMTMRQSENANTGNLGEKAMDINERARMEIRHVGNGRSDGELANKVPDQVSLDPMQRDHSLSMRKTIGSKRKSQQMMYDTSASNVGSEFSSSSSIGSNRHTHSLSASNAGSESDSSSSVDSDAQFRGQDESDSSSSTVKAARRKRLGRSWNSTYSKVMKPVSSSSASSIGAQSLSDERADTSSTSSDSDSSSSSISAYSCTSSYTICYIDDSEASSSDEKSANNDPESSLVQADIARAKDIHVSSPTNEVGKESSFDDEVDGKSSSDDQDEVHEENSSDYEVDEESSSDDEDEVHEENSSDHDLDEESSSDGEDEESSCEDEDEESSYFLGIYKWWWTK